MNLTRGILFFSLALAWVGCSSARERVSAAESADQTNTQHFLVAEGVGTEDEALAYYASLGPEFVPGEYTLDTWVHDNIGRRPTHKSLYKNHHELGFYREMTCTQYVGRGIGGCMVRNWNDPSDPGSGRPDLGTVTMNVSPQGVTQFFVFAPGGKLSPFAVLDDEGKKFVPRVCISCHSGKWDGPQAGSDLLAIFREFEPSLLDAVPGRNAEQEWFDLNQSARSANAALRTEADGARAGIDHARRAQLTYIPSMYTADSPPQSLDVRDAAHLPPSWQAQGDTPTMLAAKKRLYTRVLAPYCMTCHRTNAADWADYAQFKRLGTLLHGTSYLDLYLADETHHRPGIPFMPQAELLFRELQQDPDVRSAIDGWLAALGGPACEVGTDCTPSRVCYEGAITECSDTRVVCSSTHPSPDGTPCGKDLACNQGECIPTITIRIPHIVPGVWVRSERPGDPQAHIHVNVNGTLLVAQLDLSNMCVIANTEITMSCNTSTLTCTDPDQTETWKVTDDGALKRTSQTHPELNGLYRLESPVDVDACP